MPPKNHKKLRGRAKKKMLVTSRLMAIRLLVDDYIYKNKPISLIEAIKINKEISSLKLKCQQDTRSLQVVETLNIFMKSIIKEQSIDEQDTSSGLVTASSVENNSLANSLTSKDNNSVIVSTEDVENDVNNNIEENTTIVVFNNSDIQDTEENNITEDIIKQKKLDIINPEISVINSDVKQFESNKLIISNNSYLSLNNDYNNDLAEPANDVEESEPDLAMLATNLQKQPGKEKTCQQEIKKPNEKQIKSNKFIPPYTSGLRLNNDFNNDDLAKPSKNKPAEQDLVTLTTNMQKQQQERTCFIQEIKKSTKIAPETRNNENQTETNKKTSDINKIPAKKNIKTKTNKVINSSSKEENKSGVNKKKNKRKEKKQVNLSWVENMKYVREVTPDEHTHLQTEDSFWNNLTLPGTWNSNEFDET